jgi:hypothetical protein
VVMLLWTSALLITHGMSPASTWTYVPLFRNSFILLYGLAAIALWHAPIYGWALLVSGWARRATFLLGSVNFRLGAAGNFSLGSLAVFRDRVFREDHIRHFAFRFDVERPFDGICTGGICLQPALDRLPTTHSDQIPEHTGSLAWIAFRRGIRLRRGSAAPLSGAALILSKRQPRRKPMHPTDKAARIAGAVYLSMVFTAPFTLLYVPGKLIVRGDATATANNILAHETMFRLSIFGDLVTAVIFICLGIALYRLLSGVNKTWAMMMLAFVLISAAVGFLDTLNNIAALILFRGGDFLSVFDKPQLNALGYLFIRLHSQGIFINELFWGLWLFPFGLLVFRSGFLPRFIGVWLMINCFGYVALSVIAIFFPPFYNVAFRWAQPVLFGELVVMLWLLIKGAKVTQSPQPSPALA